MDRLTLILAAVVACGASAGLGYLRGHDIAELRAVEALAEAERENRQEERRLISEIDRLTRANIEAQNQIEADLAGANDAVDSLRAVIGRTNARADTGATCRADAATARTLLAACAAEHRDLAREADQLRATVIGLQEYARTITEQGG